MEISKWDVNETKSFYGHGLKLNARKIDRRMHNQLNTSYDKFEVIVFNLVLYKNGYSQLPVNFTTCSSHVRNL